MKAVFAFVLSMGCAVDAPTVATPVGSAPPIGPAYVEIQLTDTSVARPDGTDAQLWVTIGRLEIEHAAGAWTTIAADPMRFDLFSVEHGDASVVASSMLPPGGYRSLAVEIDTAQLVVQGVTTPVNVVNGAIELPLGSQLAGDDARALVLDFDASKSLQVPTAPANTTTAPPTLPPPGHLVLAPSITVASFAPM